MPPTRRWIRATSGVVRRRIAGMARSYMLCDQPRERVDL